MLKSRQPATGRMSVRGEGKIRSVQVSRRPALHPSTRGKGRTPSDGPVRAAWASGGAIATPDGPRTPGAPRSPPWPAAPCPVRSWWPPCRASPRSPPTGTTPATGSARATATGSRTAQHWSRRGRGARCRSTRRLGWATRHATAARPAASSGWRSCPSPGVASCANHPPCMNYTHTQHTGRVPIVIREWVRGGFNSGWGEGKR